MNSETNDVRERMQETARMIATVLPPGTGFVLLAFDQGDRPGGRLEYVSNSRREDVARSMLEFIGKVSNTWGAHGTDAQHAEALPSVDRDEAIQLLEMLPEAINRMALPNKELSGGGQTRPTVEVRHGATTPTYEY